MKAKYSVIITFIILLITGFTTDHTTTNTSRKRGDSILLFIGTYTEPGKSKGIYMYDMNTATGVLTFVGVSAQTINPSYLAIHPNHKWLYAVNELGGSGDKYL